MASVNRSHPPLVIDAPRVLLVHYTYTQQALRMSDAMADAMRERGCEVTQATIEFTDPKYVDRVTRFPMKHAFLDVLRMMPAQVRRKTRCNSSAGSGGRNGRGSRSRASS